MGGLLKKSEVIEETLGAMRQEACQDEGGTALEEYLSSIVIPALMQLLPDGIDIKTCRDVRVFQIACCKTCHTLYPHYEMYLVELPEDGKGWVCCAFRSALIGTESSAEQREAVTLDVRAILATTSMRRQN